MLLLKLAPLHAAEAEPPITVACYYFGNYHPGDPRNVQSKGPDWSEWELVKAARPRFPGHRQPNVPLWGYTDESDPRVMAKKIAAAADYGIDAFIFDWYYYNDGPFLDRPIDLGFLKAENNSRLKFAFMWANHDWLEIHPYRRGAERQILYPGTVTPENFEKICDHVIASYFPHPSYWRIDGPPYFSFYDLTTLLNSFGSVDATRVALDKFRTKAVAAGLPGLHLNAVVWGQPILPGEQKPADSPQLVKELGFDSVTSYVWIHHVQLPNCRRITTKCATLTSGIGARPNASSACPTSRMSRWVGTPAREPTRTTSSAISATRSPIPLAATRRNVSRKLWQ